MALIGLLRSGPCSVLRRRQIKAWPGNSWSIYAKIVASYRGRHHDDRRRCGKLKLLAWVILLSQAYPAFELNMTYLGGYNRIREEGFGGMDNNSYAISLVTCSGLAFFLFFIPKSGGKKPSPAASAALMVHAVLLSFSRGGMLGLIVLGLTIFVVMPKGPKECLGFLLAVVIGLSLAGQEVRDRFATSFADNEHRDASAESRLVLWAACWDTMLKHPVLGVGPDHMPLWIESDIGYQARC